MSTEKTINDTLGKNVQYTFNYDPTLLVREKRITNRKGSNITSEMVGYDVWNAYEISFLLSNGVPVHCIGKLVYPQDGEYIVESKSLKLYLNSFNMTQFDTSDKDSVIESVAKTITADLEKLLGVPVFVLLVETGVASDLVLGDLKSNLTKQDSFTPDQYTSVDHTVYSEDTLITEYNENVTILKIGSTGDTAIKISSSLLRSNCKVTHQPDWGTVYVQMNSAEPLNLKSFVEYIISFRNENHFHEEVVETIYDRLMKTFNPSELMVCAKYTRRGGIDINPIRANKVELIDPVFIGRYIHNKTSQQ